jgi:AhpD family alkylhydroperoxidase
MNRRLNVPALLPDAYEAIMGLEAWNRSALDPTLYELVKTRASMINGCAFCVDMHATDLLAAGEDPRRVLGLAAWAETGFFTDTERAALALTDAVTRLGEHGVPDDLWDPVVTELGDELVAKLLVAIGTINLWNRLAIPSRSTPPPLKK